MTLSAEDLELRRGKITSSIAAACLGLDPYCTPMRAWCRITGVDIGDDEAELAERFERGHILEPAIIEYGRRRVLERLEASKVEHLKVGTVEGPEHWMADSSDGIYRVTWDDDDLVLRISTEAKSVEQYHAPLWGEPWTDQVPQYVSIQAHWHMLHHSTEQCLVPALIGSRLALRAYIVDRDAELERALVDSLGAWHHKHVVGGDPPDPTGRDERLMRFVWKASGLELPDDPAVASLARDDCRLRDAMGSLKKERDAVRVQLQNRLREHTECRGDWGSVTWRPTKAGKSTDWRAVVEALRERVADDTLPRRLAIKGVLTQLIEENTHESGGHRSLRCRVKGYDDE